MSALQLALDALNEIAQSYTWYAHGECRGFKTKGAILTPSKSQELARTTIAALKTAIAQEPSPCTPCPDCGLQLKLVSGLIRCTCGSYFCYK